MDINRISFGTIICWKDIPHFNGLKDRLFICLGKDTTGALLLTTTTSNVDLYKSDVVRKAYRVFLSAETTPCSEDCMVDYNRASYPVLSEANDAKVIQAISEDKIVYLGSLYSQYGKNGLLVEIYKKMVKASQDLQFKVTYEQLQRIYSHYIVNGITVAPPPTI